MGPVGVQEMVVIFLVALVLFGPRKLPELGRTLGKAITEFRRAQSELKSTFETHMRELERENESVREVTRTFTNDIYSHFDSSHLYDPGHYLGESTASTTASTPAVSASAPQGAESAVTQEAIAEHLPVVPVDGAVARVAKPSHEALAHPPVEQTAPESHSVNS